MVDALNCAGGCIYGTATDPVNADNDDILFEIHKQRCADHSANKKDPWNTKIDYAVRLKQFNEQFKELKLEDFLCTYTNRDNKIKPTDRAAMEELNGESEKFVENISTINEKLSNLAAGSKEIAVKTVEIEELVERISTQMDEVIKN